MIGLLLALYPAPWRRRYGEEFRAVLESRPLGPFDVADVLLGALDARSRALRSAGSAEPSGGRFTMLRIGGFGAVFGGLLWFVGLAASSGIGGVDDARAWIGLMALGSLGILAGLIGLSAFQGHRQPRLAWVAFGVPAISTLLSAVGATSMLLLPENGSLFGQWSPWSIWMIGLIGMFVGSILFAVATYRAAVLSRPAAAALAGASVSAVLLALGTSGNGEPGEYLWVVLLVVMGAFAGSWMWLGISALRRGPIRAVAPA